MKRERAERFITEAMRLAEAFVVGLDVMFDELDDDEIQHLTEIAAERVAATPDEAAVQMVADAVNDEYGRRVQTIAGPANPETWIEF